MEKTEKDCHSVSRRQMMLGTAGALVAGSALTQFGGLLSSAQASSEKAPTWPWPYEKLDPAKTAEICYEEWYRVFCGCAVINSVFKQLTEKVGEPYTSFPSDAFVFLEGGQVGWGTVCGSPAGASIVANLIIGPRIAGSKVGHQIANDTMQWYSEEDLPLFKPAKPRIPIDKIITTQSDSPLCHVSVGKWMEASGHPLKSAERKDRCARVAASTAYHLVELLNDWKDGKFKPTGDFSAPKEHGITGQYNCNECHDTVPSPPMPPKKA